jgi:hypothetical protein
MLTGASRKNGHAVSDVEIIQLVLTGDRNALALFRLDVDSTYNPRRYQRGGGNESGPFQGFPGLDGQVDA